jgi:hypothetical protein
LPNSVYAIVPERKIDTGVNFGIWWRSYMLMNLS